jgi:hypothetical protein
MALRSRKAFSVVGFAVSAVNMRRTLDASKPARLARSFLESFSASRTEPRERQRAPGGGAS